MSAHTLGPWQFKANISSVAVYDEKGASIARLPVADASSKPRAIADARLIAAAPDLLEALEIAREALCDLPLMDPRTVAIRAAIAKATGAL